MAGLNSQLYACEEGRCELGETLGGTVSTAQRDKNVENIKEKIGELVEAVHF